MGAVPRSPSPHSRGGHRHLCQAAGGDTRAAAREVVRGRGGAVAAGVRPVCRMRAGDTKRESPNRRWFGNAPVTQFP